MNFVYMWDLKAYPRKILRIRPSEIEFESKFQQYTTAFKVHGVQYFSYCRKILELDPVRLNLRVISAFYHKNLIAKNLSDH